jgi:iron complex outermembrane receptor protein
MNGGEGIMRLRHAFVCYFTIVGLGSALDTFAQQSGSLNETSPDLQEITVTAQRRSERLQDVPITMTNLTAEQLADASIYDLASIAQLTPALRFDYNGPFFQPTIRGVGTAVVSAGGGANVGIYVDGYYSPNPEAAQFELLNVDNIQVLKGPQGTLFGRNTTGGAILVDTLKPSQTTSAIVDASYGSFNAQRYQGYFTTGLTDHVAADIAATFSKGNGYLTNVVDDDNHVSEYQNWSVRTGLKLDPTDDISLLLRYMHERKNDPSGLDGTAYVVNGQPLTTGAIIPGDIIATRPSQVAYVPNAIPGYTAENDIYQFTPTFDLGFGTLTSYSQYRQEYGSYVAGEEGSVALYNQIINVKDRTITQELLLTSKPGSPLQWTAGAFYFHYVDGYSVLLSLGGGPYFVYPGGYTPAKTVSEAGFLDATYQVTPKFYITVGARYTHDAVEDINQYNVPPGTGVTSYPDLDGNHVTPRVVLRYTPDDNSSVYASFTRGYKAAIYDLGGGAPTPVAPESMSAYEVGYKYAAHALSFDVASYFYHYSNLQVSNYGTNAVTHVPYAQVTNAADSRIYGFEGDLRYEVFNGFEIAAGGAYTNAKFTNFPNAPGFTPCFAFPACGANYGSLIPTIVNASGFEMPRAPEFTASIGPRYTMTAAGGQLAFSGNLYYTSKFYFEPSQFIVQPGYATLGLRAEWTDPSKRYTFALYGNNVTDKRYLIFGQLGQGGAGIAWSAPATVGGEVRVRFP